MIEKDLTWCNGKLTVRCPPPFPPLHLSIYREGKGTRCAESRKKKKKKRPGTLEEVSYGLCISARCLYLSPASLAHHSPFFAFLLLLFLF